MSYEVPSSYYSDPEGGIYTGDDGDSGTSWLDVLDSGIDSLITGGLQLLGGDPVTGPAGDTTVNSGSSSAAPISTTTIIIIVALSVISLGGLIVLIVTKKRRGKG